MSPLDSLASLAIQLPWNGAGVGGWNYRMSGEEVWSRRSVSMEGEDTWSRSVSTGGGLIEQRKHGMWLAKELGRRLRD